METTITRLEGRVDNLECDVKSVCEKLDSHDARITEIEKTYLIMANDLGHIREKQSEMAGNIKANSDNLLAEVKLLQEKREQDHYIEPLSRQRARYEHVWRTVIGGLVGAGVTALIAYLA